MDYKKAYSLLFRGITAALEEIEKSHIISEEIISAGIILQKLQQEIENIILKMIGGVSVIVSEDKNWIEQQVRGRVKHYNQQRIGIAIPICIFMVFLTLVMGNESFNTWISIICSVLFRPFENWSNYRQIDAVPYCNGWNRQ